jgi:hypothetical protein
MISNQTPFTRKFLLLLLGLSCLYLFLILRFGGAKINGDETRYLAYAENLSQGFYTPTDDPHLRNGPGYPLVLTPFVAMGAPAFLMKFLNLGFMLGGLWFFFSFCQTFLSDRHAFFTTLILGLYPPLLQWIPFLYSECFTFFLICGSLFFLSKWMNHPAKGIWFLLLSALFFSALIHTRVVFAYLELAMALLSFVGYIWRKRTAYRQSAISFALAFVLFLPYVSYNHSLTGKWFYLGTNGGASLYWMSSPYSGEWGNWNSEQKLPKMPEFDEHHRELYAEAFQLTHVKRDSLFKAKAKENFQAHPKAYAKNWIANLGRFVFHHPYSYRKEGIKTYFYIIPNMFLVVFAVLSLLPAWLRRNAFPPEIIVSLAVALLYFGGSSMIHATTRYLVLFVPFFLPYLAFVFGNLIRIRLAEKKNPTPPLSGTPKG